MFCSRHSCLNCLLCASAPEETISKNKNIAFALDVSSKKQANHFIELLEPYVAAFKVGLEYFISNGSLPKTNKPIILDLKLHDIPETVTRAVESACCLDNVKYITLHVQQWATLMRATELANIAGVTLLGVSVLSSMSDKDIKDIDGIVGEDVVRNQMLGKVKHGYSCGLRGFVCSPQEIKMLKNEYPDAFFLVPGIRSKGTESGDQKRIGTPAQAIKDGASMIVVGRQVRDAIDPVEEIKRIRREIQ